MTKESRCKYCSKPFLNKAKLVIHLKHAEHKFMCDGCDKWFKEPIKRNMIGEFSFCPKCYKRESQ